MHFRRTPSVKEVFHPFLESHPQHEVARAQMRHGGSIVAVELDGGFDECNAFVQKLQLAHIATSFGGPETLVCHPSNKYTCRPIELMLSTPLALLPDSCAFSIGLEDADDLVTDITNALKR
jgi:O-succinylhomoserine sulfhydrylase